MTDQYAQLRALEDQTLTPSGAPRTIVSRSPQYVPTKLVDLSSGKPWSTGGKLPFMTPASSLNPVGYRQQIAVDNSSGVPFAMRGKLPFSAYPLFQGWRNR